MPDPKQPPPPPDVVQGKVALAATKLSPIEQRVTTALQHLHTANGAAGYAAELTGLRTDAAQAAPAIENLYRAAPAAAYVERWSLVKVMADLRHPTALGHLDTIASSPLPAMTGADVEHALAEETIIRTTAAEGIALLARHGDAQATAALLKNCQSPVFSVKQASVQAYLAVGGPDARATLQGKLPASEHFVLDIHAVTASQLSQPQASGVKPRSPARDLPTPPPTGTDHSAAITGDTPPHKTK
jgi:hypothetical protein